MSNRIKKSLQICGLAFLFLFVQMGTAITFPDSPFVAKAEAKKGKNKKLSRKEITKRINELQQDIDNLGQDLAAIELTPGPAGPIGPIGPQGLAGPAGTDGLPGADGAAGPQGPQGVAGPIGPIGLTGQAGTNGADGINGTNGLDGAQGPAGESGLDTADGVYITEASLAVLISGSSVEITIKGVGLAVIGETPTVTLGSASSTNVTTNSSSEVVAEFPSIASGDYLLSVSNSQGLGEFDFTVVDVQESASSFFNKNRIYLEEKLLDAVAGEFAQMRVPCRDIEDIIINGGWLALKGGTPPETSIPIHHNDGVNHDEYFFQIRSHPGNTIQLWAFCLDVP